MSTAAPSGYVLQQIIAFAQQTLESLRLDHGQVIDDDETALAALQGEGVDVDTILQHLVQAALQAQAAAAATSSRIDDLIVRRDRFRRYEEAYRASVLQAMEALGLRKWSCPDATLSVAAGRPKVVVTDPDKLPDDLVTTQITRTPNKAAILAALLRRGEEYEFAEVISGACLSNPASGVLTIRSR